MERVIVDNVKRSSFESDIKSPLEFIPEGNLNVAIRNVMESYQDANKWLDTIKEILLVDFGCTYFSYLIHELAHTMPERFDRFGSILHSLNIRVPYPSTEELVDYPSSIKESIQDVYSILDNIVQALKDFKLECDKDSDLISSCIRVDELIEELNLIYNFLDKASSMLKSTKKSSVWDKKVYDYWIENYNTF